MQLFNLLKMAQQSVADGAIETAIVESEPQKIQQDQNHGRHDDKSGPYTSPHKPIIEADVYLEEEEYQEAETDMQQIKLSEHCYGEYESNKDQLEKAGDYYVHHREPSNSPKTLGGKHSLWIQAEEYVNSSQEAMSDPFEFKSIPQPIDVFIDAPIRQMKHKQKDQPFSGQKRKLVKNSFRNETQISQNFQSENVHEAAHETAQAVHQRNSSLTNQPKSLFAENFIKINKHRMIPGVDSFPSQHKDQIFGYNTQPISSEQPTTKQSLQSFGNPLNIKHQEHEKQDEDLNDIIKGNEEVNSAQGNEEVNTAEWHDVQIVETEDGTQELVIENLENLKDTTALIVTRTGKNFKIRIGASEERSLDYEQLPAISHSGQQQQSLQQKIKQRGLIKQSLSNQQSSNFMEYQDNNTGQLATRQSSQTSKRSNQTRISKNSSNLISKFSKKQNMNQNKFQTFQQPIPETQNVKKWIIEKRSLERNENHSSHFQKPNQIVSAQYQKKMSEVQKSQEKEVKLGSSDYVNTSSPNINLQQLQTNSKNETKEPKIEKEVKLGGSDYFDKSSPNVYFQHLTNSKNSIKEPYIEEKAKVSNEQEQWSPQQTGQSNQRTLKQEKEEILLKTQNQKRDEKGQSGKVSIIANQTLTEMFDQSLNTSQSSNLKDILKKIRSPMGESRHSRISIRLQDKINQQRDCKLSESQKLQLTISHTSTNGQFSKTDMKPNNQQLPSIAKKTLQPMSDDELRSEIKSTHDKLERQSMLRQSHTDMKGDNKYPPVVEQDQEDSSKLNSGNSRHQTGQRNDTDIRNETGRNETGQRHETGQKPYMLTESSKSRSGSRPYVKEQQNQNNMYTHQPVVMPRQKTKSLVNVVQQSATRNSYIQSIDGPKEAYVKQITHGSSRVGKAMKSVIESRTSQEFYQAEENQSSRNPTQVFQTQEVGNAYFPQILKYKETGPQSSLLSQDAYSTSQQPSNRNRRNSIKNQKNESPKYLKGLEKQFTTVKENTLPVQRESPKKIAQIQGRENQQDKPRNDLQSSINSIPSSVVRNVEVNSVTNQHKTKLHNKSFKESQQTSQFTHSSRPLVYPDGPVNIARNERSLPQTASMLSSYQTNQGEAFKQIERESLEQVKEERFRGDDEISTDQLKNRTPSITPSYNLETSNFELPQKKIVESPKYMQKESPNSTKQKDSPIQEHKIRPTQRREIPKKINSTIRKSLQKQSKERQSLEKIKEQSMKLPSNKQTQFLSTEQHESSERGQSRQSNDSHASHRHLIKGGLTSGRLGGRHCSVCIEKAQLELDKQQQSKVSLTHKPSKKGLTSPSNATTNRQPTENSQKTLSLSQQPKIKSPFPVQTQKIVQKQQESINSSVKESIASKPKELVEQEPVKLQNKRQNTIQQPNDQIFEDDKKNAVNKQFTMQKTKNLPKEVENEQVNYQNNKQNSIQEPKQWKSDAEMEATYNKNAKQNIQQEPKLTSYQMSEVQQPNKRQMKNEDLNELKENRQFESNLTGKQLIDKNSLNDDSSNYNGSRGQQFAKPIMKYMEGSEAEQKSYPLKYFKGQDLELYYMEKQLKPGVEREIKEGFFEIRKKFGGQEPISGEEVQVYVSHLCLHNYHPIFCKFNLDVVKTILNFSQIIYLKKNQTLYQKGFNEKFLYVILFGKLQLQEHESEKQVGQALNIGWTVGEEILFKNDRKLSVGLRQEKCIALCESCVLGIEKRSLAQIKRNLVEKGESEEFVKLEVVLRGNYLVKKVWRQ